MKRQPRKYIGGAVKAVLFCLLSTSSLFANSASDRLECYKANKLLPESIQISTLSDIDFSRNSFTWGDKDNIATENAAYLSDKYGDWTFTDFNKYGFLEPDPEDENCFYTRPKENTKEMLEYLYCILNHEIEEYDPSLTVGHIMELYGQILDESVAIRNCPEVRFLGDEDVSKINDGAIYRCKGMTAKQFISTETWKYGCGGIFLSEEQYTSWANELETSLKPGESRTLWVYVSEHSTKKVVLDGK